MKNSNKFYSH
jgi:hypothetical protein